jgi:hypothetical protein
LNDSGAIVRSEFVAILQVIVKHFVDAEPVDPLDPFEPVTVKENVDDFSNRRLVGDEETLVLGLGHEDRVVDSDEASLSHLKSESAIAPRVTRFQLGRSGVIVQNQSSRFFVFRGAGRSRCVVRLNSDFHGQVKEFRVSVSHLVLAQEHPDHFGRRCSVADAQRFVLDVGSETSGVDFDWRHFRIEVGQIQAGEARGPRGHGERLIGTRVERRSSEVRRILIEEEVAAVDRLAVGRSVLVQVVVVKLARQVATGPSGLVVGSGLAMFQHVVTLV